MIEGDPKADYFGVNGFFTWLERKKYKLHVRVFLSRYRGYAHLPGLRRHAAARRGPRRARFAENPSPKFARMTVAAGAAILGQPRTEHRAGGHRRQNSGRNSAAAALPGRSRAGISHARPADLHAFGRRGAAHSAGHVAGLAPGRRALRARRAFHRPAPARHASPDRNSQELCAIWATPSWSSSTIPTPWQPPIT